MRGESGAYLLRTHNTRTQIEAATEDADALVWASWSARATAHLLAARTGDPVAGAGPALIAGAREQGLGLPIGDRPFASSQ